METVCYVPSAFCVLSVFINTAIVLNVIGLFAAIRLLVLRMRAHSVGQLQPA